MNTTTTIGNHVDVPSGTNLTIVPLKGATKSFYGITYTPLNAQYPGCGGTLGDVVEDIKALSQLTTRLRLYGMDCDQASHTLEAIKQLKVNMKIVVTIWVDENPVTYKRQYDLFWKLLKDYGTNNLLGVSVGNEAIFREQSNATDLGARMSDVRSQLKAKVFTTDLGDNFKSDLIKSSDEAWANVHPYFAGVTASTAADWTWKFYDEHIGKPARAAGRIGVISETGWPTKGETKQNSIPSMANLQRFVDDFVCQTNAKDIPYYFFEAFDAPWKVAMFTELEGNWGILTKDRKPKVNFPNCPLK
ncbi:glycoside hydrolase superfamily [Syncephalis plumigaleata]|nr:glycoside hydrolase superfamily [Syncephalis plumigaleata]